MVSSPSRPRLADRGSLLPRPPLGEIAGNFLESGEFHAGMFAEMGKNPVVHHEHMGLAGNIGMDGHRVNGIVILAIPPVELVEPHALDVMRADETMAVGRGLYEHH